MASLTLDKIRFKDGFLIWGRRVFKAVIRGNPAEIRVDSWRVMIAVSAMDILALKNEKVLIFFPEPGVSATSVMEMGKIRVSRSLDLAAAMLPASMKPEISLPFLFNA
jgi:hypothetical protein